MTAVYLLIGITTLVNLGALIACLFAWRGCSRAYSTKRFNSLVADFTDLLASQDELQLQWKRFRSAEGMREVRQLRRNARGLDDPTGSPAVRRHPGDAKRELREALGVPESPLAAALKGTRVAD